MLTFTTDLLLILTVTHLEKLLYQSRRSWRLHWQPASFLHFHDHALTLIHLNMLYSLLMTWRKTMRDWQKVIHENTKSYAVLDGEIITCLQDGKMFNKPCYLSWDHSKWVQGIICNTYVLKCLIVCSDGGHIFSWKDDVITSSFQRMFKTRKSLKVLASKF